MPLDQPQSEGDRLSSLHARIADLEEQLRHHQLLASQQVQQSEEKFGKIFHNSPDPMTITRLADGRFLDVNQATLTLTGYTRNEVIGRTVTDLDLVVYPDEVIAFEHQLRAEGTVHSRQMHYRTKSGVIKTMLTSAEWIEIDGELCLLKVCKDISDRHQAETDLERAYRQTRIFADITLKVRESLQLDEILNTTVTEIQQFLRADRVIMYQIPANGTGHVVAEAVVPGFQTTLGLDIADTCFTAEYAERYRNGRIRAINDIDSGEIQYCHAALLRQFGVRANLVVPILISKSSSVISPSSLVTSPWSLGARPSSLVISPSSCDDQGQGTNDQEQGTNDQEQGTNDQGQGTTDQGQTHLWGLLIAHQCDAPRQWQPSETELMVQLANQVGIALGRAELVEALRQSEESRRLALEFSNIASWDWDIANGSVTWNEIHFRMFGLEPGEMEPTYQAWRDRIHPADIQQVEQLIIEALTNGTDYSAEYRLLLPEGNSRWVVARGRGIYDETGIAVRMVGVMLDITPRKRAQLALQQLNEQLDLRIQERTVQLQQLTHELQAEIVERRQVETALRQSEEQFRVLFESSPVGKSMLGMDSRFLMANGAFCQLLGYSVAELSQMTILDVTYPEDQPLEATVTQQLLEGVLPIAKFEKRYLSKRGDILWVAITETLVKDTSGNPMYFLRAVEDISDRKRAELALQQQAERQQLLYSITQRIRQTLDLDDILDTAVNEVWQTFQADRVLIFRMNPGQVNVVLKEAVLPGYPCCINMAWAEEYFSPDCYAYYRQGKPRIVSDVLTDVWSRCIADFMQTMHVKTKIVAPIVQIRDNDANAVWGLLVVHACAEPRQWQPAEADFLQQIANQLAIAIQQADLYHQAQRELAERQQAELALRSSETRYRAIVEDQTELITRYLPDGTVTFVNQAYCRCFGGQPEDHLHRSFFPLIPNSDQALIQQSIQAVLDGNTPFVTNEHRVVLPTGEIRWQQWTDRAIFNDRGEIVEIQGVGRDVTDRKQAEDSIRASLREKEVLLKEVHHRVKNNLQMVSSLLSLQSGVTQSDEVTEAFTESQRRIKVMALVHEKLYRSENLDQIDFSDYVQELVYDLFQSYTSATSEITLTMDVTSVDFNVDTAVTCGLIINELVSNAVKYAFPEGHSGTISISFVVMKRTSSMQPIDNDLSDSSYNSPSGMQYRLIVGDSGVGIPRELDYRNTDSLGLQLVCALTQELGGIVELDRSAGTKFTIWF